MTDEITTNHTFNNEWEFDGIHQDAIHLDMDKDHLYLTKKGSEFTVKSSEGAVVELIYEGSKSLYDINNIGLLYFIKYEFSFRNL